MSHFASSAVPILSSRVISIQRALGGRVYCPIYHLFHHKTTSFQTLESKLFPRDHFSQFRSDHCINVLRFDSLIFGVLRFLNDDVNPWALYYVRTKMISSQLIARFLMIIPNDAPKLFYRLRPTKAQEGNRKRDNEDSWRDHIEANNNKIEDSIPAPEGNWTARPSKNPCWRPLSDLPWVLQRNRIYRSANHVSLSSASWWRLPSIIYSPSLSS